VYSVPTHVTPIQVKQLLERSRERTRLNELEKSKEKEDAERNDEELLQSLYPGNVWMRKKTFK
jgi:hypothetical protein